MEQMMLLHLRSTILVHALVAVVLSGCTSSVQDASSLPDPSFDPSLVAGDYVFVAKDAVAQPDTFVLNERTVDLLPDSLQSEDPRTRRRWAKALARTWRHSDGALSEALSVAGVMYTHEHTAEFIAHFGYNEDDLLVWADLVSGEMIIADVDPVDSLDQYMDGLRLLCLECNKDDLMKIDRFGEIIRECLRRKSQ